MLICYFFEYSRICIDGPLFLSQMKAYGKVK